MIDIHSHILQDIDDGSKSIEESVNIIKNAIQNGVKAIVLTPHYIEGSTYNAYNLKKQKKFDELKEELKKQDIKIKLFLGNEVMISSSMLKLLDEQEITTINETKYLLMELPMKNIANNLDDVIFRLRSAGIIPIIAHPERYKIIQDEPKIAFNWVRQGALLQSNLGSVYGGYGKEAQKTLHKLLKRHAISFLASDIHHDNQSVYNRLSKIKLELIKKYDVSYIGSLISLNASKVLQNEEVKCELLPEKKSIFSRNKN